MMTTQTNDNSGGTGYCAGNDFTIKPLTTTVDIKLVRRLMATWHTNGLTDSNIRKMMLLYLGEPAWMDLNKVYPCGNFYNISRGLRYGSKTDFLNIILRSKGFGYIWKDNKAEHNIKNLFAFYTPIWHEEKEEDMVVDNASEQPGNNGTAPNATQIQSGSTQNPANSVRYNSLYDNIIKKNIKKKVYSYYVSAQNFQNFSPEQKARIEAAAKSLINYIATDQDAYTNIVETINETTLKLMPELYIDKKAACPATMATRQFFNAYLYPYLLEHSERMMKIPTLLGQSCWIKNLIQKDFMQKKISAAVSDIRLYLMQHAAEMIRQNRPVSAYEYQDKETEQRFYDVRNKDGTIKQIRIPNEAPPRPSDSAAWNKFAKKWNQ